MKKLVWGVLACGVVMGCASPAPETAAKVEKAAAPVGKKQVVYRNGEGRLLCPVMNTVIASEKDAVGYQDYKGTRYYFCCEMCPPKFKSDPEKYAAK